MDDILIVGAGPAGLTAAIYAVRAGLSVRLFDPMGFGGKLFSIHQIENFPGFPDGVSGADLIERMADQAKKLGAVFEMQAVESVDCKGPIKTLHAGGKEWQGRGLILCSGSSPKHLDVPGELELVGKGVSYCATCDGNFFKNRDVAVIGGGDTALTSAVYLTKLCRSVTVIHRRDAFRASAIEVERAKAHPAIHFQLNSTVEAFEGDTGLERLRLRNTVSGEESELPMNGAFILVGHVAGTAWLGDQLALENGYVAVDTLANTSEEGVWAAGDVCEPRFEQVVAACAQGARAAQSAAEYL